MEDRPTFYISGKMRGMPELNFPAFDTARNRGESLGLIVISPADMDRAAGFDSTCDKPTILDMRKVAERDLHAILSLRAERGDGIAAIPGWETSTGAITELYLGRWLGLKLVSTIDFTAPLTLTGPKEVWKDVKDKQLRGIQISNRGRLRRLYLDKTVVYKWQQDRKNYYMTRLSVNNYRTNVYAHRLVAQAFCAPAKNGGQQVRHLAPHVDRPPATAVTRH